MNVDNFLVRPKCRQVENYSNPKAWESLTAEDIAEIVEHLAPLPPTIVDADEMAKRFDLVVLASNSPCCATTPRWKSMRPRSARSPTGAR
jgi:hypothetical protein